ncbi:MAG: CCA tRNA nucleotidyltransferase [Phycisphaerales bacterium]
MADEVRDSSVGGGARQVAAGIVRRLREAGHAALFAGGCVRDELLGLEPSDYDVATDAPPERVTELFRNTRVVGKAFGVVPVRLRGVTVDVATFRKESGYTDRRRPDSVEFTDAEGDASRRDFTINALFIDPLDHAGPRGELGTVIDYVGGVADLKRGLVRAVGDPDARLSEDHLRALRAVRFCARLGFELENATGEAITRHTRDLLGVSRERIGDELRGMLSHPRRALAVELMQRLGLDGPVLGEASEPGKFGGELALLRRLPRGASFAGSLAAWSADRLGAADGPARGVTDGVRLDSEAMVKLAKEAVPRLRSALVLSNLERDELKGGLTGVSLLEKDWDSLRVSRQKRVATSAWFPAAIEFVRARSGDAAANVERRIEELAQTPGGLRPEPMVTGDDLIAAGLRPGPAFGHWLERLYDLQLEGELAGREEGVGLVKGWARGGE